jgi:hypothetical protein
MPELKEIKGLVFDALGFRLEQIRIQLFTFPLQWRTPAGEARRILALECVN